MTLFTAGYIFEMYTIAKSKQNATLIIGIVLFSAVYIVSTIVTILVMLQITENMRLYKDKVVTKFDGKTKYITVDLNEINEIVIVEQSLFSFNASELALRVNSKHGLVLGYGRHALNALLNSYPEMKFRVNYIGRMLGRKNAILLGQRGFLGKYKIKQVAKLYHLSEDFAVPRVEEED